MPAMGYVYSFDGALAIPHAGLPSADPEGNNISEGDYGVTKRISDEKLPMTANFILPHANAQQNNGQQSSSVGNSSTPHCAQVHHCNDHEAVLQLGDINHRPISGDEQGRSSPRKYLGRRPGIREIRQNELTIDDRRTRYSSAAKR